jgi:hypothetical protein
LKRFLIVPLLSTFALLTPTVSLAQQPTTMSAKSVAKLPFSSGLELDPARAWESSRTHVAGRVEVLFWSSVESPSSAAQEKVRRVNFGQRVIGTIAGALIGVWLVGDYTSTPAVFLPVLFLGEGE